jgi:hypothetical protein
MSAHRSVFKHPAISRTLVACFPPILQVRPKQDETPDHFAARTLGSMRANGVRSLAVTCPKCHHEAIISAEPWPDDMPLPLFGPRMDARNAGPWAPTCGRIGGSAGGRSAAAIPATMGAAFGSRFFVLGGYNLSVGVGNARRGVCFAGLTCLCRSVMFINTTLALEKFCNWP